jgi:hypothetical protein
MVCPQCAAEMSRKWSPNATKAVGATAVVWACGVCGCQLTQADLKTLAKQSRSLGVAPTPLTSV